ncbi:MAG: tetratricopeptide repeat protein, partial [Planctomycetota bacterium]
EGRGVKEVELKEGEYTGPIEKGPTPLPINSEHFLRTASDDMNRKVTLLEFTLYVSRLIAASGTIKLDDLLDGNEVNDITLYMRSWETEKLRPHLTNQQIIETRKIRDEAAQLLNKGEMKQTVSLLEAAVKINPEDVPSLLMLAETMLMLGEQKKAEQYFRQALSINPLLSAPYVSLAKIYLSSEGKEKEAIYVLRKAQIVSPQNVEAISLLAQTYEKIKTFEFAADNWNKLIKIIPSNPLPYLRLGLIAEEQNKDYQKALEYYNKALELNPDIEDLHERIEKLKKILLKDK